MKTTWKWVVGGLLVLALVLLAVRERYTNYEEALKAVGQTAGYILPKCPDGYTLTSDRTGCEKPKSDGSMERVDPTCAEGSKFVSDGAQGHCEGTSVSPPEPTPTPSPSEPTPTPSPSEPTPTPSSSAPPPPPPVPGSAGPGATTASTTGGESGVTYGPTSAPKGGRNVWGPLFKGTGQGQSGAVGGDSTKTAVYPALMGGMEGRSGTMLNDVGVVAPSGFGLDTVMPSSSALGTDANSRFLPYSRQPGDMDLVPDPYRLAKTFSTSSYSMSKTDPVPFLTDFSAFYR